MLAALSVALAWGAPTRAAVPMQPLGLSVDGGEASWHADRDFALWWTNPPRDGEPPLAAVHYRLLDPAGEWTVLREKIEWPATSIQHLTLPGLGAYLAEVWLEDAEGNLGEPVRATLRFDDARPGPVEPPAVDRWLGRGAFPLRLRLGHPEGAEPLSGIRGYAVSIDSSPGDAPCAGTRTCTENETDLRGGVGDDLLSIGRLAEGDHWLHAVAVSGSGVRSATVGATVLRVDTTPPLTSLDGVPGTWVRGPVTVTATATDPASGMEAEKGEVPFTAIRIDGGTPIVAPGNEVSATVIESGVHAVAHYARDLAGNVGDGGSVNGLPNPEPAMALVRIDREPPRVAFTGAQRPADPELIQVAAGDPLSGLDPRRGQISVRPAGTSARFEPLPTEVVAGSLRARWPSEAYRPGEYEFRATAYDMAGNSALTSSRASGAAMRLRAPLKIATTLLAGLGEAQGPALRTISYGRGAKLEGRLIAGRRAPLGGEAVRVIERLGGAGDERESALRTDSEGRFAIRLAPGPSREIVVVAPPTGSLQGARSRVLRLAVRGGVRLRVSSHLAAVGGRPVIFSGRVGSRGEIPADGKAVELQFRLPGLPWSEFRTVRSDGSGRFRLRYRFADDDSRGVRFWFRAFAPAQAGWPFEPASSRPVTVRGR